MKNLFGALLFLLLLAISACSDSSSSSGDVAGDEPLISVPAGMVAVHAFQKTAVVGSDNGLARSNEQPCMSVEFSYDFGLGEHEVTCGEFSKLADKKWGFFAECESDSSKKLPMVDVTYYDAVLFANAKSRDENLDTCYQYTAAEFDEDGHCVGLENLTFVADVDGYRLPTEAEWMFVATKYWDADNSWDSKNSDYKAHAVCSKRKPNSPFCDLAGNVKEWTNDWLGFFKDTSIVNFAGAPDGGSLGERVIKGGSFRNDLDGVEIYNRGDVYSVTSLTHGDYLGMRLAYGKIPDAVWLGNNGHASTSVIQLYATVKKMFAAVGSYQSVLAFRNDETGNLAFVDFGSGSPSVIEIADTIESYHPDISPDGSKVAFCTGLEGVGQTSKLYVRNLDSAGTGLVQLDVESAAIPRWHVEAADTSIIYVTDAGVNNKDGEFLEKSTWQVPFKEGKFGTPKKLFDGAYHGGVSDRLAVSGARLLRARVAVGEGPKPKEFKDTVWYNSEQACNVSLANDGSRRTLFLDFGGKTGRDFVGKDYGVHDRLLIADENGKLVQSVAAPAGYSFDHSEWVLNATAGSTTSEMAVVSLTDANGAHTRLALVNLTDSSVVALASGKELWHPSLWVKSTPKVKENPELNMDSAGIYLAEKHEELFSIVRHKLDLYWNSLAKTEVLIVGSSRAEMGVDPDALTDWNALNMGAIGIDPDRDIYFIRNYILNHEEKLKAVIVSIDLDGWRNRDPTLAPLLLSAPGYIYDRDHGFWANGVPKDFGKIVHNAYPAEKAITEMYSAVGGRHANSRSWNSDGIESANDSVFSDIEMNFLDDRMRAIVEVADSAGKRGIYLIGIVFPQAPQYKNTGSLGRYGLQRSVAEKKIAWLDSVAAVHKNFIFLDENKMGNHGLGDDMAYNMDHLSSGGSKKIAAKVDSVLKTLKW